MIYTPSLHMMSFNSIKSSCTGNSFQIVQIDTGICIISVFFFSPIVIEEFFLKMDVKM